MLGEASCGELAGSTRTQEAASRTGRGLEGAGGEEGGKEVEGGDDIPHSQDQCRQ